MAFKANGGSEESEDIVAEINITPLTDIFLVLLIIFMVTSTVMNQSGMDVQLPKASSAQSASEPEGVIVTLMPSGEMRVNSRPVKSQDFDGLSHEIEAAFAKTASRLVILQGDRQAFLGNAIAVMDAARKVGAAKFAIATESSAN